MASLSSLVYFLFSKARNLPYSGAPERFLNRVGSCFTNRHKTKLERLAMDKHYSLLRKFANYEPRAQCHKTFYGRNLLMVIIS
jgi:hypothetical protein